ncbi:MAG: hypothetical protein M3345_01980, partial [Actinomycetota bacterium]|nr:hypothetical protein [Actinomycetota bacterium]
RIVNLTVGPTPVPVLNPTPNQVVFEQAGIKIVFWETNWDPATGATTDDSSTVYANALHVTAPGGIDLVVSHSEATATCDRVQAGGGKNPPAECEDEVDNDGDGEIDFPNDPGCSSPKDDSEIDADRGPVPAPAASPIDVEPAFTG